MTEKLLALPTIKKVYKYAINAHLTVDFNALFDKLNQ